MKIPVPNLPQWGMYAAAGVALGLVAYVTLRGVKGVTKDVVGGVATAAADVIEGGIVGLGSAVGIPETNKTQCEIDRAAGNSWEASKSCPASDFISYGWNKLFGGK